ncbi:phage tail tape measure protein [Pseudomonas sp. 148P]|uniref:Phage tail tape measure protein n=1 Tax=Pseudomonas ulcerans TaxID=3115852 RepID=A0ABU7HW07_9PSED|nr:MULTISPECIES: phage tail tape measure protein [unclassified Pseudomonas]MEE1922905.1 phage tail tape measure protein [Pseudomonas sp. 147P]MEE1935755.1 phage tail tape measure protein [Pseudomonas sp. 148P]
MADRFQLKALITGVDKLSPVLQGVRKNAAILRKQLNNSGLGKITFGEALQGGAIAAPFVMGVKAAMGFESAMADVKKVVNFETPAQFKAMSDDVLGLSERLPMTAEGIAQIVAAGGQSGIAREELNRFAEDAVKMGVAFDQTAEQSGQMMAKWRTAFKMNQDEVVTLADQINYLGNTGAASTGQISEIITAIGPLGEVAGVNAAQLAAMGSTLAGVGIAQDVAATGIKNFMLTLTAGTAATKSQKEAFKSLRLDTNEIAKGMQTDSEGTINKILQTLAKVDKAKQAAVLTQLFGKESVGAIAPLLTSLGTLQTNFKAVGKDGKYAGSMTGEYEARAATTQNAVQLLQNKVTRLGISVGSMLLPPFNDFLDMVGPLVSQVTSLAVAHPGLIKGILGAAVGFTVLRLAAAGATAMLTLMNGVASMSPIGLVVRGIAIAAGLVIANWSTIGPYFQRVWAMIEAPAMRVWGWIKTALSWTPLGQLIANWGPLTEFFGATWELIKALSVPFFDFLKSAFEWTPLGQVVKHWEPLTAYFKGLWDKLRPIIEPMMKFLGFESEGGADGAGVISAATNKVKAWTEEQQARNAAGQPVPGALVRPVVDAPQLMPQATSAASLLRVPVPQAANGPLLSVVPAAPVPPTQQPLPPVASMPAVAAAPKAAPAPLPSVSYDPRDPDAKDPFLLPASTANKVRYPGAGLVAPQTQGEKSLPASRGSLVEQATVNKTKLEGSMLVRFENAPAGMRVDQPQTNQPGLSVTPQVGYRSLGGGGA